MRGRLLESLDEVAPAQWDALHDGRNPFVSHAFLHGLESTGCLRAEWGWTPRHLSLWDDGELVGAAPAYLKSNSHGEFVFDHAWARAYAEHGLDYYPKWLCGVPYSPVTGPRLLARDGRTRAALARVMAELGDAGRLSSCHINFHTEEDAAAVDGSWLRRLDVQYHWRNDAGWRSFDDFLAALDHRHRKNIRQERARVRRAGIEFHVVDGYEASEAALATMHGFYVQTFLEYGNHPALTLDFFRHLARRMPDAFVLSIALRGDTPVAGALCLRGGDTLYGRYWGASETIPGLHFETCYYQGIEYCLRHGLTRFEPGAQGEHKIARGFLPTLVHSSHRVSHPGFRDALATWCAEERAHVRRNAATLSEHSPFRNSRPDAPSSRPPAD